MEASYSIKKISNALLTDIKKSLKSIDGWGSVELYVQNNEVTQITVRSIKKTNKKFQEKGGLQSRQ